MDEIEASNALLDLMPTGKEMVLVVIGALLGFLPTILLSRFPDLRYRLPFLYPRHSAQLEGKANLLHHLSARAGDQANWKHVSLSDSFKPPGPNDGTEWDVSNLVIRTRWNSDALLTCNLSWMQKGKKWTATVKGKGRYFGRRHEDFDGYIYVVCDCVGVSGSTSTSWKVVYELRRKADPTEGWDGYWLMFDADDRTHSKFGLLDLHYAQT